METKKVCQGLYRVTYLGYTFTISKQWISGLWSYSQDFTIKQYPDVYIHGDVPRLKDAKRAIQYQMGDLFAVKY